VYQERPAAAAGDASEEEDTPEIKVTIREATEALEKLLLYDNQQMEENLDAKLTQALHSYKSRLNRRRLEIHSKKIQGRLEDFWAPHHEHLPVKEQVALAKAAYQKTLESGSEMLHDSDLERTGVDPPRGPRGASDSESSFRQVRVT
jgi:hypothetical protein